jgi:hypothetical protein
VARRRSHATTIRGSDPAAPFSSTRTTHCPSLSSPTEPQRTPGCALGGLWVGARPLRGGAAISIPQIPPPEHFALPLGGAGSRRPGLLRPRGRDPQLAEAHLLQSSGHRLQSGEPGVGGGKVERIRAGPVWPGTTPGGPRAEGVPF